MYFSSAITTVLALASFAAAVPTGQFKRSVVESLDGPPAGWVADKNAVLDKDTGSITLRFHLVSQDMDKFHKIAMDVSR